MAVTVSKQQVELREVVLRNKPEQMLSASPKGTVPVLVLGENSVLEESLDIMLWALRANDPHQWLSPEIGSEQEMLDLIEKIDGEFKAHLDAYKYAPRKVEEGSEVQREAHSHRDKALAILAEELETRLIKHDYLFGNRISLADVAIAPFVRQFANTDIDWFKDQPNTVLISWLDGFVTSDLFASVMPKFEPWAEGQNPILFPQEATSEELSIQN